MRPVDFSRGTISSRVDRRGDHGALPVEIGKRAVWDTEIIREHMTGCLRQPFRQGALAVSAAIQHANDLGVVLPDVLDRVSAIAGDVGATACRKLGDGNTLVGSE